LELPVTVARCAMLIVKSDAKINAKQDAIRRLLDDKTPIVRQAVLNELSNWNENGRTFLCEMAKGEGSIVDAAEELLGELGWEDGEHPFRRFIRSFSYELESGFLLMDKVIRPLTDLVFIRQRLDDLANRCSELLVLPSSSRERCRTISRVLFHEEGLRGATIDFDNPNNSSLSYALDAKKGLPLTLSVIYLFVARRVGLELEPVGLPGRFMVGCFHDEAPFYLDSFEGGRIRNMEEVMLFLRRRNLNDSPQWLLPMTVGDVLRRACRNLVSQYQRTGHEKSAQLFCSFEKEFKDAYRRAS
jgi:regulator of sirC expression with transglutaminase-like and TPR domain